MTPEETHARNKHAAFMRGFKHGASLNAMCEKHGKHPTMAKPYGSGYTPSILRTQVGDQSP
jgi:hypothetical protein